MKWNLTMRQEGGLRSYPCVAIDMGGSTSPMLAEGFGAVLSAIAPKLVMAYGRCANLEHMCSLVEDGSEGIEIGCDWGDGLLRLLETGAAKIHGVDPYLPDTTAQFTSLPAEGMDKRYDIVVERTKSERVQIHRAASQDYLKDVKPGSMDWIFIDGDHHEEPAYQDMCLSYDALRSGGIMVIDDTRCDLWGKYVKPALDRFLVDHGMEPVNLVCDPVIYRKI